MEERFCLLKKNIPNPSTELKYNSSFELLIAVILSAQATDVSVNKATIHLFKIANTPEKISLLPIKKIESLIKNIGLFRTKAKNILKTSKIISQKYSGKIPKDRKTLESLPGVGRKTANVILNTIFREPVIAVDTHIFRLLKRWGISSGKNVDKVEKDAKRCFPQKLWNKLHLQIIFFGREYCPARGHVIEKCPICNIVENN